MVVQIVALQSLAHSWDDEELTLGSQEYRLLLCGLSPLALQFSQGLKEENCHLLLKSR